MSGSGKSEEADELWVIDAHCHAASLDFTPQAFIDASLDNLAAVIEASGMRPNRDQMTSRVLAHMRDDHCDELVSEMDRARISMSILLVPDFTAALPGGRMSIEQMFLRHHEIAKRHPGRFEIFGGVDPHWGRPGIDLFERAVVELGFAGLKLYPPCGYSPSDERLFPLYELCEQHRIPVLLHIGPTSPSLAFNFARPELLDVAARRFKSVDFILAHAAISHVEDCIQLCRYRPNVYLDISGYQRDGPRGEGVTNVKRIVAAGIVHKVLFGSDWPVFRDRGSQQDFRGYLDADDGPFEALGARQIELVMRDNVRRLLGKRRTAPLSETGAPVIVGEAQSPGGNAR